MNENSTDLPAFKQEPGVLENTGILQEPDKEQELAIELEPEIKQEQGIRQEPGVKKESVEYDDRVPLKRKGKEILLEFSRSRKKIIYLDGSNTLFGEYHKLLYADPTLSDLLYTAYPIFQEFNSKFKTWVDLDHEENLTDGAVVKVRLFFKTTESNSSYSGSNKRKRDDFDTEPNPKQRRTHKDSLENYSNSGIKSPERNYVKNDRGSPDVENVAPERRSNISSPDTRKCQTARKPIMKYSDPISVRKNLFPRHRSNSLDRWGAEGSPVPPSPGSERKLWFMRPEETHTTAHVTSTNVEPQNVAEMGAADLCPDPHLPGYAVEQTTQGMLSERQTSNATGASTPVEIHPIVFDEKQPANSPLKPAPLPRVSERTIAWNLFVPTAMKTKRLLWGLKNLEKIWWNTVFSDVAVFYLGGNRIKYYENINFGKKDCEIFLGVRSFDGPNILTHLGFSLSGCKLAEALKNKVVKSIKNHYKGCGITLQILGSLKTQFDSKIVRDVLKMNSIALSEWPSCARDLSPVCHAWKLVGEKVKNIPCSSKQEMISIVTEVWEKDLDVQLMSSNIITLLPQIIKSVVEQLGSCPRVKAKYIMTT